jgi:hypothetical protein
VDGPFFNRFFLAGNSRTFHASCARALSWWRIHLSGQNLGLFLRNRFL